MFGWLSPYAPFAKACGACLNLNCALIVMPVTKLLLARLNNAGLSYSKVSPHPMTPTTLLCYTAAQRHSDTATPLRDD